MPNCFSLTRKGESAPTPLTTIDEEICALLGREVHPKLWVESWYDNIGFALAMGQTWNQIRCRMAAVMMEPRKVWHAHSGEWDVNDYNQTMTDMRILTYLERNYDYDAWVEIGRR